MGVDLQTMTWHTQPKYDPGRAIFQWEHVNPVSSILEGCKQVTSEEAILHILKTRLRLAWILKRENEELTRLGYRSKRVDPEGAYRDAKIELLK
ncbi:hypothetical protein AYO40_04445 [Planctomycetaceae bacterium SCGC AG-212-D15]|nr:hypothetical protein AYO40_04445 [Planctomycetaceae bacterium SCGC AG-212-D15]